jgi:hypothetical protein
VAGHPLKPATDRRLGRPLPHQLPNPTRADPPPINLSPMTSLPMGVSGITPGFPGLFQREGHVPTRYSPVRRSPPIKQACLLDDSKSSSSLLEGGRARLACVKPAASVRSEPGSNSQVETCRSRSLTDEPLHIVWFVRTRPKRHRSPCIVPFGNDDRQTVKLTLPSSGFP